MAVRHYFNTEVEDAVEYFTSQKNGTLQRTMNLKKLLREYSLFRGRQITGERQEGEKKVILQIGIPEFSERVLEAFAETEKRNEMHTRPANAAEFVRDYAIPVFFDFQKGRIDKILEEAGLE